MPAGRPCIITAELIEQVAILLPKALYIETVASQLGIHRDTFRDWMTVGAREQRRRDKGHEPDPKRDMHVQFSATVKKVTAEAETNFLSCLQLAGAANWTALAWILERRFPQRWATNRGELRALAKEMAKMNANANAKSHSQPDSQSQTADKSHIATDPDA